MNKDERVIKLTGVLNVRELGGLRVHNGRKVKTGKLIRAGRLSNLTEADIRILSSKWNITMIVDLRNEQEISEHPDVEIEGADFRNISIIQGELSGISREDFGMDIIDWAIMRAKNLKENGGSGEFLEKMYEQMAKENHCQEKMKEFFESLTEHQNGAFLWHCTSGKDRTGVTGALLLYALGADMETIKADYLYTNEQNFEYREKLLEAMRERGAKEDVVEQMRVLESVSWSYIERFFDAIRKQYGSIEQFLEVKIGLTREKRKLLLESYTESE